MKLFGINFSWGSKAKSAASVAAFLRGSEGESGGTTLSNAYAQSVWVHACIRTMARSVAGLGVYFEQGEKPIERGPMVDLFDRPHPLWNDFAFWELVITWQQLRGEAFVVPTNDRDEVINLSRKGASKQVKRLHVLPPEAFREIVEGNELKGWQFTGSSNTTTLPTQYFLPEEVIHLKLANPFDPWRGFAPLQVAAVASATDFASAQFMRGLMTNNADTGVIITTEQQLDGDQREQILAAMKERKRKAGTADRPLLLWGGAKVEKPTLSSADMQFLENRKFNRQEICAVFGVPQELLGFTEDANRSVGDAARLNFLENTIGPYCEQLVADFDLLVRGYGENVEMGFAIEDHPAMQAARRARFVTAKDVFGTMGVPLNNLNDVFDLGLPDDLAHGDKIFLPFSLMEYGGAADPNNPDNQQPTPDPSQEWNPSEPNPADGNTDPNTDTPPADDASAKLFDGLEKALALASEQGRKGAGENSTPAPSLTRTPAQAYEAAIAGSVRLKQAKLSRFFFEQRARVLANLETALKSIGHPASGIGHQASAISHRALPDDIFKLDDENSILLSRLTPLLREDLRFGLAQVSREIGVSLFDIPPQDAIDFLATRSNAIKSINETTFGHLKAQLQDGLTNGETTAQLADRVRATLNVTQAKAEVIAITETNVAVNSGRQTAMEQAQVDLKAWLSSHTENARPSHALAEQVYEAGIPLDQKFVVGGEEMMHPGDPAASAANTINCKCHVTAVRGGKALRVTLSFEQFLNSQGGAN